MWQSCFSTASQTPLLSQLWLLAVYVSVQIGRVFLVHPALNSATPEQRTALIPFPNGLDETTKPK